MLLEVSRHFKGNERAQAVSEKVKRQIQLLFEFLAQHGNECIKMINGWTRDPKFVAGQAYDLKL